MTKGKIITVAVSIELTEDIGHDLHTELTGLAHEALTAMLATIPEATSISCGWRVETPEPKRHRLNRARHQIIRDRQRKPEIPEPVAGGKAN
jgi:hypothetical protein